MVSGWSPICLQLLTLVTLTELLLGKFNLFSYWSPGFIISQHTMGNRNHAKYCRCHVAFSSLASCFDSASLWICVVISLWLGITDPSPVIRLENKTKTSSTPEVIKLGVITCFTKPWDCLYCFRAFLLQITVSLPLTFFSHVNFKRSHSFWRHYFDDRNTIFPKVILCCQSQARNCNSICYISAIGCILVWSLFFVGLFSLLNLLYYAVNTIEVACNFQFSEKRRESFLFFLL